MPRGAYSDMVSMVTKDFYLPFLALKDLVQGKKKREKTPWFYINIPSNLESSLRIILLLFPVNNYCNY